MFFLSYSSDHRALHSFPTRRSSDLLLCPSPLSLSLLPALLIDGRQLGHQHAAEHQTAADEAAQTQHLAENQPAGQCCKHGLKTENDRSMGSDGILLGHHLQGEPYTHCENTAEGNRRGCQQYCREVCFLQGGCQHQAHHSTYRELDEGDTDRIIA